MHKQRTPLSEYAKHYHLRLPGFIRATLIDYGLSDAAIDAFGLGWDGEAVTIPILDEGGTVVFFERWDAGDVGVALAPQSPVELYPWTLVNTRPPCLIVAEGVHEALVFLSQGLPAVAATGTGLFYKDREWTPPLKSVREVVVAFRRGEKRSRKSHVLSRSEVLDRISRALPQARYVEWPPLVGKGEGAYEYFRTHEHTAEDFKSLVAWA